MGKGGSPLLGYNTNVRHKGKLYHIQTEDSGIHHPHIITHLFADGGRILASKKTSYAEHVGQDDLKATVKKLMQDQHKAMFIALRDGVYDEDEEGLPQSGEHPVPDSGEQPAPAPAPAPAQAQAQAQAGPASSGVDVDALEAAAARFQSEGPGADAAEPSGQPSPPQPSDAGSGHSGPLPAGPGRYRTTEPTQDVIDTSKRSVESIFGEDLLTEKSLDEVILSYLAEDLEDTQD